MMKKLGSYVLVVVICLFYGRCVDPIDFELDAKFKDAIVIQAQLVKGEDNSYVEVNITRLFDFTQESRLPVNVQQVVLYDDQGEQMELQTRSPGRYNVPLDASTPIQAEVGRGYRLRVRTLDGRTFDSTMDIMPPNLTPTSLDIDRVTVEFINEDDEFTTSDRIALSIDTEIDLDSEGGVFWEIRNIYRVTDSGINSGEIKTCYLEGVANTNNIYVLDPRNFTDRQVTNFPLAQLPLTTFMAEGMYYEVRQYSLSPGAFAYWNAIDILSEREGSVFDRPVGEVPTNFTNTEASDDAVFGYFFASEEKLIRKRIPQELISDIATTCPSVRPCFAGPGGTCICGLCCDCLDDPSATLERPSWWID